VKRRRKRRASDDVRNFSWSRKLHEHEAETVVLVPGSFAVGALYGQTVTTSLLLSSRLMTFSTRPDEAIGVFGFHLTIQRRRGVGNCGSSVALRCNRSPILLVDEDKRLLLHSDALDYCQH